MTQPLFSALANRLGHRRIAALGVVFNAILFSLIGVVPNVYILFGLILAGRNTHRSPDLPVLSLY